jgi:hypothetical protein
MRVEAGMEAGHQIQRTLPAVNHGMLGRRAPFRNVVDSDLLTNLLISALESSGLARQETEIVDCIRQYDPRQTVEKYTLFNCRVDALQSDAPGETERLPAPPAHA